MTSSDKIGGRVVQKFLDAWYKHPLSLCIVMTLVSFSFVYMLINNKINSADSVVVVKYTYSFSGIMLLMIILVLLFKKEVLYNVVDGLTYDMTHRIHILDEIFEDFQLGIDLQEEELGRLCPKLAKYPIDDSMRVQVLTFEFITHVLKDCGIYRNLEGKTSLALAKFYYKEAKYQKALEKINTISSNKGDHFRPGEVDFCKGLILYSLGREAESQQYFVKAKQNHHKDATCWLCTKVKDFNEEGDIQKIIESTQKCSNNYNNKELEHCLFKLSKEFFLHGKTLSLYDEQREKKLKKAHEIIDFEINKLNSQTACYDMACVLCIMAQHNMHNISIDKFKKIDEEKIKDEIILNLKKAFTKKPALVKYCLKDEDLNWVKDNYAVDYHALIGEFYMKYYEYYL